MVRSLAGRERRTVIVEFPYHDFGSMEVPDENLMGIYGLPEAESLKDVPARVSEVLANPTGTPPLKELARGKRRVLIVADDISRPTPVHAVLPPVLRELHEAGVPEDGIEFLLALGMHRPMTREEFAAKLGSEVVSRYRVHNHDWKDPDACSLMGKTPDGAEVWINKLVAEADLVIGVGRIMPIDICGFSGGGKILIPGVCGHITNSQMHWHRVFADNTEIIGKRDNRVRETIDCMAREAGLDFILNIIMSDSEHIVDVVAGDLVEAHREGCEKARAVHEVHIPAPADIVVADGHPFDIEFWQANKALDTAGLVVRRGGVVILLSPCYEGFSRTYPEVAEIGYQPVERIIDMVESGKIKDRVIGVHMIQVSLVAIEKATAILVTNGIPSGVVREAGLSYAPTAAEALEMALQMKGKDARVAVLRRAAEMLAVVDDPGK